MLIFRTIQSNDMTTLRQMLSEQPELIDQTDINGMTPLLWAAYNENHPMVELILQYEPNHAATDAHGLTALHFAAELGQYEIARMLIEYGANVSAKDNLGKTPLYLATINNHKPVILLLLQELETTLHVEEAT